jgi:crotonobetainyl-CoA:carnitine CoA-transferase CaiB-like acyl-CoA transferase
VETSLFEAALGLSIWEGAEFFATGEAPQPLGSAHRLSAPYQAFRASDGFLTIAALTTHHWERLCRILDRPEFLTDARYVTNAERLGHVDALVADIERALSARTVDDWVERLLAEGIPCGPILDYAEVFGAPHTTARKMVEVVDHPEDGPVRTMGIPVKLSETPGSVRRHPPLLGEHTKDVLASLNGARSPWSGA